MICILEEDPSGLQEALSLFWTDQNAASTYARPNYMGSVTP